MNTSELSIPITLATERGLDGVPITGTLVTITDTDGNSICLFVERAAFKFATVIELKVAGRSCRPLPSWVDEPPTASDATWLPSFETPLMRAALSRVRSEGAERLRVLDWRDRSDHDDDEHFHIGATPPRLEGDLAMMLRVLREWRPTTDLRVLVKAARRPTDKTT